MSLLAVDIGSSTCKAVVFAASGQILAQESSSYLPEFPAPSFAEMDPERFWNAVCTCTRAVAKNLKDAVRAVGLSSHGETFVAIDARGQPLNKAILNQDSRAIQESLWCEEVIGRRRLFQVTGLIAHPMYPIPKILWLRRHQPKVFADAQCFVTVVGYLLGKMGLPAYVDYSLASRFLAFDVRKHAWSHEVLSATELNEQCLPTPVPTGTIAGKLSAVVASQMGLSPGTPVVLGGHDQPCAAVGSGVIGGGRVSDSMGTYECLLAASDEPSLNDKALAGSLNSFCHVVPDKFVTLAYFPSGIMVKWFHDLFYENSGGDGSSSPAAGDFASKHYEYLETHAPVRPTGLCITPHLIGTCNPEFNPHARGVIAGLGPETDRIQIYKGILEGIACELSLVAGLLADAVGEFEDVYVAGGGTRSALGLELRAALTGRRLHVMSTQEAVCLGTAILAGVAVGEYGCICDAVDAVVHESSVVPPSESLRRSYAEQFKRYKELRSSVVQQA